VTKAELLTEREELRAILSVALVPLVEALDRLNVEPKRKAPAKSKKKRRGPNRALTTSA
jgi:hypothetical protein